MKALIGAGLAFSLLASSAFAQQPPAPDQPEGTEQEEVGNPPSLQPPQAGEDRDGWGHHMDGHHKPPRTKAAAFRIEAGDISVGMKCPDDEPLKACADFTLQLLDKLGSMQRR